MSKSRLSIIWKMVVIKVVGLIPKIYSCHKHFLICRPLKSYSKRRIFIGIRLVYARWVQKSIGTTGAEKYRYDRC